MADTNQNSTQSSEDERVFHSNMRMILSEHLTPQIAVNYLFKWRNQPKYIEPLLSRLFQLCLKQSVHYIPTIIFIMSLEDNNLFQKFCWKVAQESFSHYLLVRWSYSTYLDSNKKHTQTIITKLDSCLLRQELGDNHSLEALKERAMHKQSLSNYTEHINLFFEKMFTFPERLKKYEKSKRNQKLRQYLSRISKKFISNRCQYIDGIAFPINLQSNIVVNILTDHCFTFSTKQRVPFKLVIETISFDDAKRIQQGESPQYKTEEQMHQQQQEAYILPQSYFGTEWSKTRKLIVEKSIYGKIASHKVKCYMVKSGDDLRQQYMAMQLISLINQIFQKQNIKIWMKPYSIIPYSSDSGLIQFIDDTKTISYLKEMSHERSLRNIYKQIFGSNWQASITNFIQSLAGYSLIQYLFDIKDRHNNNILVDVFGHIIHIDFSFMLSSSPGNMNFERAPFKLTKDYIELMEGQDSDIFQHFKLLFFLGLKYLRKYKKDIMELIMMMTECKGMKCFIKFDRKRLQQKFYQNTTDAQLQLIVEQIIKDACNSYTTSQYDVFQWFTNRIQI